MCSFSWRDFGDHIGIAFNRDETVLRAKALPPKLFGDTPHQFIMPIDPDAGGSWICLNQAGLVFALLNNYQGKVKPKTNQLNSRGEIIKSLAQCRTAEQAGLLMEQLDLTKFQPFSLLMISRQQRGMWEYDGLTSEIKRLALPQHYFSSAHPEAPRVLRERLSVAENWPIQSEQDLLNLHRSHLPNNAQVTQEDRTFSICMHFSKGHTQSLSYIKLSTEYAEFKYWNGQPCQTQDFTTTKIDLL